MLTTLYCLKKKKQEMRRHLIDEFNGHFSEITKANTKTLIYSVLALQLIATLDSHIVR